MFEKFKAYTAVVWQLIKIDLIAYSSTRYLHELIDSFFWASTTLVVSANLLTSFGMRPGFGIFVATGIPATRCLFQIYARSTSTIVDLMSNKAITYDLTLPIPSWLALMRIIFSSFIRSMMLSLPALPFALLFTWREFDIAQFSLVKYLLILTLCSLFCGAFGLFISSSVQTTEEISSIWNRIVSPMWMLGGFQFSWITMMQKIPWLGYLTLINPFLYAMEGMRASVLGQAGYLPYWVCAIVLILSTLVSGYFGIRKMSKRLDCV